MGGGARAQTVLPHPRPRGTCCGLLPCHTEECSFDKGNPQCVVSLGVQMVPISWCEMQCPRTHTKDFRKVARVQPQFLQT